MTEDRESVGLVGAGLLGTAIAERLLAAGFALVAHDPDSDRRDHVRSLGGEVASDPRAVTHRCRRIVLCLPNSDVVASVIDEVRNELTNNHLVVDTTTGDPSTTGRIAGALPEEVGWIDACVLGSSEQCRRGEAMLLVGGADADLDGANDLLEAIATDRRHLGPVGSGQRAKLVANLVLGLNRAALAEGLHLAESLGLDARSMLDVLAGGVTYSRVMDVKGPRMVGRNYDPVARLSQHLKDVRLILAAAEAAGTGLPFSEVHRRVLERAEKLGFGDADNAAIVEALRTPDSA